ncbi:MAG: hypothetical protein ABJC61_14850 [Acidobacteriota bacterium]
MGLPGQRRSARLYLTRLVLWVAPAALSAGLAGCQRNVVLSGTSNNDNGVLVTDGNSTAAAGYQSYHSAATTFSVGDKTGAGEVAGFTKYRPMAITSPASWSAGDVPVRFVNQLSLPVTVWIVKGPFASQKASALNALTTTDQIWWDERVGVVDSPLAINDATGNSKASTYFNFTCTQQSALQTDIGQTAGRINIYFLDKVDRGGGSYAQGNGNACAIGSSFVAVGSSIGTDLLVHETGHDFGLTHVDDLTTDFDATNVMFSSSNSRQYFTEGQTFRAHMTPGSAINAVFNARPGQPTRNCARDTATAQCPLIKKRIWADGAFPAN